MFNIVLKGLLKPQRTYDHKKRSQFMIQNLNLKM